MSSSSNNMLLLSNKGSPFGMRVQIALNLKKLEYEFTEIEFVNGKLAENELLLESNPVYKKIPVLIHNDKPTCESAIIVQYIDEVCAAAETGPSILPSDPHDRALARFWGTYIDQWIISFFTMIVRAKTEAEEAEAKEKTIAGVGILEEAFVKCSKGKEFFGGESIGYVDIALGCTLAWIRAAELCGFKVFDEVRSPQLVGWAERFRSHEAVKGMMPEANMFVPLITSVRALRTG